MSKLTFIDPSHWALLENHLTTLQGERFAFAHTRLARTTPDGPILHVIDIELIADEDVEADRTGWSLTDARMDRVHNAAIQGRYGLVEFHNHHLGPPGFSRTDEAGLEPMADYVTGLLADHPYGAGVYADGRVHVEHWTRTPPGISRGTFRSVSVLGDHLRILNAPDPPAHERLARQGDLLGISGRSTLAKLRIALVGVGGTGSHAAIALAYLGARDIVILDDDHVEMSNLNRLVTAGLADLDAPKGLVARRRMREVEPELRICVMPALTSHGDHYELDDVDLIIGCVDHDGPRDRLNQIAVDTATPYIDIATGIDPTVSPSVVGGRVILVDPARPCLHCLGELDSEEVGRWAKDPGQQELDRQHGYGVNAPNPSVVHLNGLAVYAAIGEIVAWIAGSRRPAGYLDIDLSGHLSRTDSPPGCRVIPRHDAKTVPGCIGCAHRRGDPPQLSW